MIILHFVAEVGISINILMGELVSLQHYVLTSFLYLMSLFSYCEFITVLMHYLFFVTLITETVHICRCQ